MNQFKTGDLVDTPTRDQIAGAYSDLHKSAYGFRPDLTFIYTAPMAEVEREFERVQQASADAVEEEKAAEAANAVRFEKRVAATIAVGAKDRATAIRWIKEAHDADTDGELEYHLGLNYGYLQRTGGAS